MTGSFQALSEGLQGLRCRHAFSYKRITVVLFYCKALPNHPVFNARILCTSASLRGLVTIGNVTYGIEPMDSSSGSEHILYSLDNVKKEPSMCGVTTEGHEEGEHIGENHHPSMTQLLRVSAPLFSPVPCNGFHECSAKKYGSSLADFSGA